MFLIERREVRGSCPLNDIQIPMKTLDSLVLLCYSLVRAELEVAEMFITILKCLT